MLENLANSMEAEFRMLENLANSMEAELRTLENLANSMEAEFLANSVEAEFRMLENLANSMEAEFRMLEIPQREPVSQPTRSNSEVHVPFWQGDVVALRRFLSMSSDSWLTR